MAGGDQLELHVSLDGEFADSETLADSAAQLIQELSDLDVDDVRQAEGGAAPPGSKGVELLAVGALIVDLARNTKVLTQIVDTVRDWLNRNDAESVRLEIGGDIIEVKGASSDERRALIESWVQRHAGT